MSEFGKYRVDSLDTFKGNLWYGCGHVEIVGAYGVRENAEGRVE